MLKKLAIFTSTILILSACAPLMIGGVAGTGAAAHDRRTFGTFIDDNALEIQIASSLAQSPAIDKASHINNTVYNGIVLLSGEVSNPQIAYNAEQIAARMNGVRQVNNQLFVGRSSSFSERNYDTKQTAKVKAALLDVRLPNFDFTRVKVVTERGITYLMGIVNEREAMAATEIVSKVSGVRRVVTLFEIR